MCVDTLRSDRQCNQVHLSQKWHYSASSLTRLGFPIVGTGQLLYWSTFIIDVVNAQLFSEAMLEHGEDCIPEGIK